MNKIVVHEWDYTCGDGCCYAQGVNVTVNETEIRLHEFDTDAMKRVLDALGVEYELEYINDSY